MMAFVVVLGGAGYHSTDHEVDYKKMLKKSCQSAISNALSTRFGGVLHAICSLENNSLTNAGYGASLTRLGTVEMDAIIVDGQSGCFGSVTGLSRVRNPIKAAMKVLECQLQPPERERKAGLVQPSCLASSGALNLCKRHNLDVCQPNELITEERQKEFEELTNILERSTKKVNEKTTPQDTVGAICIRKNSAEGGFSISAGSSSGGNVLKLPGRVGPAACIGSNCWCEQSSDGSVFCGVVVSGDGEYIMAKVIARSVALLVVNGAGTDADSSPPTINLTSNAFKKLRLFNDADAHILGIVVVFARQIGAEPDALVIDVVWAHSSPSLALGFAQSESAPFAKISRLKKSPQIGSDGKLLVEGRSLLLS